MYNYYTDKKKEKEEQIRKKNVEHEEKMKANRKSMK